MIDIKYIKSFIYKYQRFHVWYNQKVEEYYQKKGIEHKLIVDMRPYDYKAVRKMQKKHSDHWSNLIGVVATVLIIVITCVIIFYIINEIHS